MRPLTTATGTPERLQARRKFGHSSSSIKITCDGCTRRKKRRTEKLVSAGKRRQSSSGKS